MISFDLKCTHDHVFEAWFRSSAAYDEQRAAGLVACPVCGDASVAKAVMAPAVAAKGNQRPAAAMPEEDAAQAPVAMAHGAGGEARMKALLAEIAEAQSRALEKSEWVGDKFAEQVRAMHYGEKDHALVHGTADSREARAMMEEGLPVAPLLVPVAPPDKTH
jgi:hypothetical protein